MGLISAYIIQVHHWEQPQAKRRVGPRVLHVSRLMNDWINRLLCELTSGAVHYLLTLSTEASVCNLSKENNNTVPGSVGGQNNTNTKGWVQPRPCIRMITAEMCTCSFSPVQA